MGFSCKFPKKPIHFPVDGEEKLVPRKVTDDRLEFVLTQWRDQHGGEVGGLGHFWTWDTLWLCQNSYWKSPLK